MKPPPFAYHAPTTLDEALATLAELGEDAKVLAGGQSLIPLLNMRLAAPRALVDINRIGGLGDVEVTADHVRVGALVRHTELERHDGAARANPLLRQALQHVAHPVIRNRGTTVGSIAHADPAGEMPAVMAVLDGEVELRSAAGTRTVAAGDYFLGPLESDTRPGEIATAVRFPNPGPRSGTALMELSRRHGDYALAGVAVVVTLDEAQRVHRVRAGYLGVDVVPLVLDLTEACRQQLADAFDPASAVELATGKLDPEDDIHATADYRRHLAGVLTGRALRAAVARARAAEGGNAADVASTGGSP